MQKARTATIDKVTKANGALAKFDVGLSLQTVDVFVDMIRWAAFGRAIYSDMQRNARDYEVEPKPRIGRPPGRPRKSYDVLPPVPPAPPRPRGNGRNGATRRTGPKPIKTSA